MTAITLLALCLVQDRPPTPLQEKLRDTNLAGRWIYDDVESGYGEAKRTGRPLMVVFR